jgi:acyl dehydratase
VRWASASGDFSEIHYDKNFAQSQGLPGIVLHSRLVTAFLGQLLTDWIGNRGIIRKLPCNYRGMLFPNDDIVCKGKITRKYIQDN